MRKRVTTGIVAAITAAALSVPAAGLAAKGGTPNAHATTNAYSTCAKRQLTDANVEPGVHYAQTRNAQFGIVEARALLALNRPAEAKAVLENSKRLAQEVFDWRRSGNGASDLGSRDNRPSFYHDSAKDILDAANAMLAKLNAPPAPAASASPAAAPHR